MRGKKVGVTLHEKKRIRRDNDSEEKEDLSMYVCTCTYITMIEKSMEISKVARFFSSPSIPNSQ